MQKMVAEMVRFGFLPQQRVYSRICVGSVSQRHANAIASQRYDNMSELAMDTLPGRPTRAMLTYQKGFYCQVIFTIQGISFGLRTIK